ncbi:MAG TPA: hypothetical protein VGK27_01390 [Candidatus Deferrimicrobiaceae bacterium]|jgi:hypothetical protein
MAKEGPIKAEMFVGDVLQKYPAVRDKVSVLFGPTCLQCKSNQRETIVYTAWHKGLDPKQVVRELNAALSAK